MKIPGLNRDQKAPKEEKPQKTKAPSAPKKQSTSPRKPKGRSVSMPLGIDISSSSIRIVAISHIDNEIVVDDVALSSLPPGIVSGSLVTDIKAVGKIIKKAIADQRIKAKSCIISIGARDAHIDFQSFPKMSNGERIKASKVIASQFLPNIPESNIAITLEAVVGRENYFMRGFAVKNVVDSRVAAAKAAGLSVLAVDHEMFAWYRSAPIADAVLDIGQGKATLTVFRQPLPESHSFDFDLADSYEASLRHMLEAILESRSSGSTIETIVLVGDVSNSDSFAEDLERETHLRVGYVDAPLRSNLGGGQSLEGEEASPEWLLAYGLALWSLPHDQFIIARQNNSSGVERMS